MMWFGGTLPLASTPIWGLEGGVVGISGRSLSWAVVQGMAVPQQCCCSWSSAPTGAAGFKVCHCSTIESHHGLRGGSLFLRAGCVVTPCTADGFAVLGCWVVQSQESQVRALCLRQRLLLQPLVCLWPGLTWAL